MKTYLKYWKVNSLGAFEINKKTSESSPSSFNDDELMKNLQLDARE